MRESGYCLKVVGFKAAELIMVFLFVAVLVVA